MLSIPSSIRVAGIDYDVIEKDFVEIDGNRNYQGSCCYTKAKIELLNSLSKDRKEQVLIHELVHAIFNEAGFDNQEEDVVNRLSIVLYQVLKDNNLYFGD